MTGTYLQQIIERKRQRVAKAKAECDLDALRSRAVDMSSRAKHFALSAALQNRSRFNIIAEIKRSSPSRGAINQSVDVEDFTRRYEAGDACAISVLTEEDFFGGSLADLRMVRGATSLPLLRKDFIIDEFQIYESAAAGADAVLLIAAALSRDELQNFFKLATDTLLMDAVVEVHDADELRVAEKIGAAIIGINNRSLETFDVSLDVSRSLVAQNYSKALIISESGITGRSDIEELSGLGFDGFLIGETLMRSGDPERMLRELSLRVRPAESVS